jgi:hypothetical protein
LFEGCRLYRLKVAGRAGFSNLPTFNFVKKTGGCKAKSAKPPAFKNWEEILET